MSNKRFVRGRLIDALLRDVLYHGELGRMAARERWPDSLRIFIEENAREPLPHEIARMRRGPAEADECMADFERRHAAGEDIFGIERLRGIHQAMIERNARLAEQIEKQEVETL